MHAMLPNTVVTRFTPTVSCEVPRPRLFHKVCAEASNNGGGQWSSSRLLMTCGFFLTCIQHVQVLAPLLCEHEADTFLSVPRKSGWQSGSALF